MELANLAKLVNRSLITLYLIIYGLLYKEPIKNILSAMDNQWPQINILEYNYKLRCWNHLKDFDSSLDVKTDNMVEQWLMQVQGQGFSVDLALISVNRVSSLSLYKEPALHLPYMPEYLLNGSQMYRATIGGISQA